MRRSTRIPYRPPFRRATHIRRCVRADRGTSADPRTRQAHDPDGPLRSRHRPRPQALAHATAPGTRKPPPPEIPGPEPIRLKPQDPRRSGDAPRRPDKRLRAIGQLIHAVADLRAADLGPSKGAREPRCQDPRMAPRRPHRPGRPRALWLALWARFVYSIFASHNDAPRDDVSESGEVEGHSNHHASALTEETPGQSRALISTPTVALRYFVAAMRRTRRIGAVAAGWNGRGVSAWRSMIFQGRS